MLGRSRRWPALVVAVEVLVAGGCVYAGAQALRPAPAAVVRQVRRGAPAAPAWGQAPLPALSLPVSPRRQAPAWPVLGPGLIDRLSRDDYSLYQKQWQVIQLLMQGIRRYVEQRLAPSLSSIHS